MKIVLLGYMGSGKTSIGQKLAQELSCSFVDLDTEIERRAGQKLPQIFSSEGEIWFRKTENLVLADLLGSENNFVLATGGGTPCYGNAMELISNAKDTVSVYLKTTIPELCDRIFPERESRPLVAHLGSMERLAEFIGIHLFERTRFYNQANLVVETTGRSVEEISDEIRSLL